MDTAALAEEKRALRAEIRKRERALDAGRKAESDASICRALAALPAFAAADVVLAFFGTAREIDTRPFLRRTLALGKTLCLPRCEEARALSLRVVRSLDGDLAPGAFGIPEPRPDCPALAPEEIGFAVIPCVSFDGDGNRLGQGGGYYDRLLPRLRCETACVCRAALVARRVPHGARDAKCSLYLTEAGVVLAPPPAK